MPGCSYLPSITFASHPKRWRLWIPVMEKTEAFFRLVNRVALVTGGGQGIGEAICRRFAEAGARIAVFDRMAEGAERVAKKIGGLALFGDVTSKKNVEGAVAETRGKLGSVDILVNNAGITGKAGRIWELTK